MRHRCADALAVLRRSYETPPPSKPRSSKYLAAQARKAALGGAVGGHRWDREKAREFSRKGAEARRAQAARARVAKAQEVVTLPPQVPVTPVMSKAERLEVLKSLWQQVKERA